MGLSGQMHGATLLDAADKPLRPAILWNDGRSEQQCVTLEKAEPRSREITGNIAMPGFTAPKLVWVRENEPAVFKDTRCVLLPKDYVRLLHDGREGQRLLGCRRHAVGGRRQAQMVARDAGRHGPQRIAHAARSSKARTPPARCARKWPTDWGMDPVPVAGGGGDNAAGAAGIGVIKPGDAFLSLGTSGVLFLVTPKFLPNPGQGRARLLPLPARASGTR